MSCDNGDLISWLLDGCGAGGGGWEKWGLNNLHKHESSFIVVDHKCAHGNCYLVIPVPIFIHQIHSQLNGPGFGVSLTAAALLPFQRIYPILKIWLFFAKYFI